MRSCRWMLKLNFLSYVLLTRFDLLLDTLRFIRVSLQPRYSLAAENRFLRKQLALCIERRVKPCWAEAAVKYLLGNCMASRAGQQNERFMRQTASMKRTQMERHA